MPILNGFIFGVRGFVLKQVQDVAAAPPAMSNVTDIKDETSRALA